MAEKNFVELCAAIRDALPAGEQALWLCNGELSGQSHERYDYQKRFVRFTIPKGAKVLDVGSGAHPFPSATILADAFINETTHRPGEALERDERPFVVMRIDHLPFATGSFDYVYCSHLLEHVDDPARCCDELMRVGKAGYVETPSRLSDVMFNFTRLPNHHKWHITLQGKTLVFQEWQAKDRRDTGCGAFFKLVHSTYRNPFQELFYGNTDLFYNMLEWDVGFGYVVIDASGRITAERKISV